MKSNKNSTAEKRIGILSLVYQNWNFGGMLQGYALAQVLKRISSSTHQIRVSRSSLDRSLRGRINSILKSNKFFADISSRITTYKDRRDLNAFRIFQKNDIACSHYYNANTIKNANKYYDCFVAGSDQIWNAERLSVSVVDMFGLMFAEANKRKIAYAASVGSESCIAKNKELFMNILENIDHVSVREQSTKEVLQSLTSKKIEVVLDPTLLLKAEEWDAVSVAPKSGEQYIFSYFLKESDNRHNEQLKLIADTVDMKNTVISDEHGIYNRNHDEEIFNAGPKEFVGYIKYSDLVVTNSFHGLVFAVLYHKPFWIVRRNRDTDKQSMNSRIMDFLKMIKLEDRLLADAEVPSQNQLMQPIDFTYVDQILDEKRKNSLDWLEKAINSL